MADRRAFFEGFVDLMYRRRDVRTAFDTYVAEDYVQHNPGLPDGRDAARDPLARMFADPSHLDQRPAVAVDGDRQLRRVDPPAVDGEVDAGQRRQRQRAVPVGVDGDVEAVGGGGERVGAHHLVVEGSHVRSSQAASVSRLVSRPPPGTGM